MPVWVANYEWTPEGDVFMQSSIVFQLGARTLPALLSIVVLAQVGFVPTAAEAQVQPDWLVAVNSVRTSAGLPAVVADSASTTGATNHSRYVVRNNLLEHAEDPSKPGYTADGDAAGQRGDIGWRSSPVTAQDMLATFMTGGYHWEPILDPGLTSVGYGTATFQEVFPGQTNAGGIAFAFTLVFNRSSSRAAQPILWPPSGGTLPYTSYTGGETPNALANCAGYTTPTGPSLSVQLPSAPQVTGVTLTRTGATTNLAVCWFTGATVKFDANDQAWTSTGTNILNGANAVVVFPQQPLTNGTYCVSVTNAGAPITWSFSVGTSPATPPAPCGSGTVATPTPTSAAATSTPTAALPTFTPTVTAPTATPTGAAPGSAPAAPTPTPTPAAPAQAAPVSATDRLTAGQQLTVGQQLLSPDGKVRLQMQADGYMCVYYVDRNLFSGCAGEGDTQTTRVVMQNDGDLVMLTGDDSIAWSAGTSGNPGASLVLFNNGDLLIVDQNGAELWRRLRILP
jgi:hypothetical protein